MLTRPHPRPRAPRRRVGLGLEWDHVAECTGKAAAPEPARVRAAYGTP